MIEIIRLSDEEIEALKKVGRDTHCRECPLDDWPGGCTEIWKGKCSEVAAKAIELEMEARKKDMEEKKQLPTESELRAELQDLCDKLNAISCNTANKIHVAKSSEECIINDHLCLCNNDTGLRISMPLFFRPEPKPPAKNKIVLSKVGRLRFSNGTFTENGDLRVTETPNSSSILLLTLWITLDRTQCSEGWNPEWEKGWWL